jgi:hypothetical protein
MRIERFEATEFQDVSDHAGRTRAAIRGFIKYLVSYERDQQKNQP